jgi:hypothetical protein
MHYIATELRLFAFVLNTIHVSMKRLYYSQRNRFWPLKCLNWNLEASHLPEVCGKQWKGREGRGKGINLNVSFLFLS